MHQTTRSSAPLDVEELAQIDAWWRAANYLAIGQIYLLANPLLREPLLPEHIKPRLLGHWGTTPGLNLLYAHVNRLIRAHDLDAIFIAGPGHGGPALCASTWLEGSYTERWPTVTRDADGMHRLFRQFSFPGGVPSHVAPETPGSIHEGGELGYSLSHAYGAALDNPDLLVACVIGDGEAETGPLAASWHANKFLDPATDGAVLPILHLNGWKIANPTVLARIGDDELAALLTGYGHRPIFVTGDDPELTCTRRSRRPWTTRMRTFGGSSRTHAMPAAPSDHAGLRSCCARRRAGPVRRSSTDSRSRAPGGHTRCHSPEPGRIPSISPSSSSG